MAEILGRAGNGGYCEQEARGNVQRVIRTATGMNMVTSVAGSGGFLECNPIFNRNSTEIDDLLSKSLQPRFGEKTRGVYRPMCVAGAQTGSTSAAWGWGKY